LNSETNSEDQKVSSEVDQNGLMVVQKLCSEASEGRSEANPESSSEAVFRSFRRTFRSEPIIIFRRAFRSKLIIIFRSCVQKLQKGVQKRTQNHQEREEHARHM